MEKSPLQSPSTVTIRRNPHRSARPTVSKAAIEGPFLNSLSSETPSVPNFPLNEILSMETNLQENLKTPSLKPPISFDSLKVFLRIRPLPIIPSKSSKLNQIKVKKTTKICLVVNDSHSVTVTPPSCDSSRLKSEEYNGFSHVFDSDSSQDEVYEKLMRPMVEEFLNGKSGLLAALGPSGSGKTHSVFGSAKEPGLVPRVLHHIFDLDDTKSSVMSRSFYLSIFEIYSEKGKGEKLSDLSPDGSDIYMQQSNVKGLKEILVKDAAQAESILAQAKSKRATAMTNSNSQSSRSQCIINIRCVAGANKGESESLSKDAVLTFADLAGAEREKKTGNKGGRLRESNFINNTSMVFGLCLRSLLEHQKNPKKPLQKHFQSSLLTRYLRDYLEGRKRMALILTVRSGEEDYFDTSFLLRQASPYMEIKFCDVEETTDIPHNKRRHKITGNVQHKRVKLSDPAGRDDVGMTTRDFENLQKEGGNKRNHVSQVDSVPENNCTDSDLQRQYYVMQGFAKALWVVLKQYKERVKVMQKDIDILTDNLRIGHAQYVMMEKELLNLKSQCSCPKHVLGDTLATEVGCQTSDSKGRIAGISHLEEESGSGIIKDGLLELVQPVSDNVSKVHMDDFPSGSKSFHSVDESIDPNATLTSSSHKATLFSADVQMSTPKSYQAQQSSMECQVSPEMSRDNSHDEDQRKDSNKGLADVAAHLPSSDVMDLIDEDKSCDCASQNMMDKESVSHGLGSNYKSELETRESTHSKPSKTVTQHEIVKEIVANGPGNIIKSELELKETDVKPSKAVRPKRRLMPASSLLLRDAGNIDVTDENVKLRERGGQKLVEDEEKRSKGNASLMRLLKNHLPR